MLLECFCFQIVLVFIVLIVVPYTWQEFKYSNMEKDWDGLVGGVPPQIIALSASFFLCFCTGMGRSALPTQTGPGRAPF